MRITAFQLIHGKTLSVDKEITKKDMAMLAALIATATISSPTGAMASTGDIIDKITKAGQPIKDIIIGAADPVCYVVFAWGFLECMLGKGSSGLTRMKYAALGFMGINWMPVFMEILRSAKP